MGKKIKKLVLSCNNVALTSKFRPNTCYHQLHKREKIAQEYDDIIDLSMYNH
jgi:hypothetical protein